MGKRKINVEQLTSDERRRLLNRIWDTMSDDDGPLTAAKRKELGRRLDALDQDDPEGIPWETILRRLER